MEFRARKILVQNDKAIIHIVPRLTDLLSRDQEKTPMIENMQMAWVHTGNLNKTTE